LEVQTNEFLNALPPCRKVDHKTELVFKVALPSKLNQRELKELKR
jgi:hypothetical protein